MMRNLSIIFITALSLSLTACKDSASDNDGADATNTSNTANNSSQPITPGTMPKTMSAAGANQHSNATPIMNTRMYPPELLNPVDLHYIPNECLDGMLTLSIPDMFRPMTDKEQEIKYPGGKRPHFAVTDDSTAINVTASYLDENAEPGQLYEYHMLFKQRVDTMRPDTEWVSHELTTVNERRSWISQFRQQLIDVEVYNMVLGTSVNGRVLLITFNMPSALEDKWVPIASQILNSAEIDENAGSENSGG